jgi:hypothetical protein
MKVKTLILKYIKTTFRKIYNSIPYAITIIIILFLFPLDSHVSIVINFIYEYLNIDITKENLNFINLFINKLLLITIGFILKDIFKFIWNKIKIKRIKRNFYSYYSIKMENYSFSKKDRNISKLNYDEWLKQKKK